MFDASRMIQVYIQAILEIILKCTSLCYSVYAPVMVSIAALNNLYWYNALPHHPLITTYYIML